MEPDLCDLMSAWLGREMEPTRREELLSRLRRDEGFRTAFVAEIRMLGMLKTVQSPESRWLRLEDELGWSASEPSSAETLEDRIVRQLDDTPRPSPSRRLRWSAAAAVLLGAALGLSYLIRGTRPAPVAEARSYPKVDAVNGLAIVVKLDRVRWDSADDMHPSEGSILAAGRFRFAEGRVILSMLTGVVLDVEGPADVDLISSDKVLCRRGRIRARVPAGAEGFLVLGPSAAVVDLGTEFGVNVGADGKMQGRVFKGRLEAALLSAEGTPQRSYFLDASKANATKAFEVDSRSGRIDAVDAPGDFVAASDPSVPPLALEADYARMILRSKPWGYWRFESLEGDLVPNELPGRPPLRATGPIRLTAATEANRSAEFLAGQGRQFLAMDEDWHPPWSPGYAVEFWCLAESIQHASLVSIVTPKETDHHVFLMELTSRNRLTIHKPASLRLLHRWPPGWEGGDNTYSQDPYVPYHWHHIVGQIRGERIELYTDGEPSSLASVTPEHGDVPCQFLLGRLSTRPGSGLSIDRPFVGRMDEVALYDRPLSLEEIREHYGRGNRQRGGSR